MQILLYFVWSNLAVTKTRTGLGLNWRWTVTVIFIFYGFTPFYQLFSLLLPYKILEGENFGETVYTKNWQIIVWRMPKIDKAPKIIIMCQLFTSRLEF